MQRIEAAIFDMDGLMLDSEPLWQEAEMRVFRSVGIELTREECLPFIGVPVGEVVAERFRRHPWPGRTPQQVTEEIIVGVAELIRRRGELLPGVWDTLRFIEGKGVKRGVASSSAMLLIEAVMTQFGLRETFDALHSAEREERGKPHPDVFLSTARQLGVAPEACIVFEDSVNGLAAADAAGMRTVVVPAPEQFDDARFSRASLKLRTLAGFGEHEWNRLLRMPAPAAS